MCRPPASPAPYKSDIPIQTSWFFSIFSGLLTPKSAMVCLACFHDLLFFRKTPHPFCILKPAINSEPLGPYNKELLDLSVISHNPKSLAIIEDVLHKKLTRVISTASTPRRLNSTSTYTRKSPPMSRTASVHSSSGDSKSHLVVLKCLTVMVHLCQYGSSAFMEWTRSVYREIVVPIGQLAFHPQYLNAIYLKVGLLVRYCEDEFQWEHSRNSVDQMRAEMRPGIVGSD